MLDFRWGPLEKVLPEMFSVEEMVSKLTMAPSVSSPRKQRRMRGSLSDGAPRKQMNSSRRYNVTSIYYIYINYYKMINDVNIASKTSKLKYKHDEDFIYTTQKLAPWQQCKLAFVA